MPWGRGSPWAENQVFDLVFCVVILLVVLDSRGSAILVFLVRTLFSSCNRVVPVVISNELKDSG